MLPQATLSASIAECTCLAHTNNCASDPKGGRWALAVISPSMTDEIFRPPAGVLWQLVYVPNLQLFGLWDNHLRKGQDASFNATACTITESASVELTLVTISPVVQLMGTLSAKLIKNCIETAVLPAAALPVPWASSTRSAMLIEAVHSLGRAPQPHRWPQLLFSHCLGIQAMHLCV
jgi:hypothetical protein